PGRSIRYSQGLRRIPRSRPRRRRRGVAAVLTSSSSASGAGAAGVLIEVIDPSLSGAGARRLPHPDPCDRSVGFLGQLVHLVDDLLAAAGGPALQLRGQSVLVELPGQILQARVADDLIEDRAAVRIGLGDERGGRGAQRVLPVGTEASAAVLV